MKPIENQKMEIRSSQFAVRNSAAFTLIELLVVISIIGVLAGLTIPVLASVKATQKKKVARGELEYLETALENYKAKYGAYPPSNQNGNYTLPVTNSLLPQLYYELSGTVINGANYVTLDGSSTIAINSVTNAYGVGGFLNCTRGNGEDDIKAKNFLSTISQKQIYVGWTNPPNGSPTTILVTSVGGPDDNYHPLDPSLGTGPNPFRYKCPGDNNPNSYDLWVQLKISGKTYLICNWSSQMQVNSSLP